MIIVIAHDFLRPAPRDAKNFSMNSSFFQAPANFAAACARSEKVPVTSLRETYRHLRMYAPFFLQRKKKFSEWT
jgi:hypothetical protein